MEDYDQWTLRTLERMGFDSVERREMRKRVLTFVHNGSNDVLARAWKLQDGYGRPGATPPQGFDWSGIRDSSYEAVETMRKEFNL